jgi:hypothetical protein
MNRIREITSGYQVLTTPHRKYDVGFEFILGSWTDEGLLGFKVHEYDNYADAECEAMRRPDISWEKLHEFHKDQYALFGDIVTKVLDFTRITSNFYPNLMSPHRIKNTMMNRVLKAQQNMNLSNLYDDSADTSFRLAYDMNDIISYTIVNPWSTNLDKIESFLLAESRLNIYKSHRSNGVIHLVGRTDIGTTYEIILAPTIMYHFMLWKEENYDTGSTRMGAELTKAIKTQRVIDRTDPIT